uniref:Claudin n=1 Tax=Anabas testudineus TaxID=64144 RepID=A0A7N6B6R3_ANATE
MSTAMESTGFVMCIISWLVTGVSLANDQWKISSVSGTIITAQRLTENLWHSCAENSAGMSECRDFVSLLALPVHVQACRALMIISLLLGLISMIVALLGMKCIKIGSATEQSKAKIAVAGGILSVSCLVACSWYAYSVVQDFYNPLTGGVKYELGTGLFLGWAGASLAIVGGGLLCSAMSRARSEVKKGRKYISTGLTSFFSALI